MHIERIGHKRIVTIGNKWMTFGESVSEQYIGFMAPMLIKKYGKKVEYDKPSTNFGTTCTRWKEGNCPNLCAIRI